MTNQEAFDKAALHLLRQGRASMDEAGDWCMYRGHDGAMCAVGALIPDCEYQERFERQGASEIYSDVPALHGVRSELLEHLQIVHDRCPEPSVWPAQLREVAARHALSAAVIDAWESEVLL